MTRPETHHCSPADARRVQVSGDGVVRVPTDAVEARLTTAFEAATLVEALAGGQQAATKLTQVVDALGVAPAQRQTSALRLEPVWDNEGRVRGQRAVNSLAVTLRDIARLPKLLTAAADACGDALQVDQVRMVVTDVTEAERRARDLAWEDALARATQLAERSGARLGRVLSIVEGGSEAEAPMPRMAKAMAMDGGVEAGENEVRVSLSVSFELD